MQIYLNYQKINIFDPLTKAKIISGEYKNQFWIVKLKVINNSDGVVFYALLAKIQEDPQTYKEAVNSREEINQKKAVDLEVNSFNGWIINEILELIELKLMNSFNENGLFEIVERGSVQVQNEGLNILYSRWIFKRNIDESWKR